MGKMRKNGVKKIAARRADKKKGPQRAEKKKVSIISVKKGGRGRGFFSEKMKK